jgi:hypothetical protein
MELSRMTTSRRLDALFLHKPEDKVKVQEKGKVPATKIKTICSVLVSNKITTAKELTKNMKDLIEQINIKDPKLFYKDGSHESVKKNIKIFREALTAYQTHTPLPMSGELKSASIEEVFKKALKRTQSAPASLETKKAKKISADPTTRTGSTWQRQQDNLNRITKSYDRFVESDEILNKTSKDIANILLTNDHGKCSNLILGCGHVGTAAWVEKYPHLHGETQQQLDQEKLPPLVMIGNTYGTFSLEKDTHTLTQRHSILEQAGRKSNPSDFTLEETYQQNSFVDGKHLYQSDIINLGKSDAPVLRSAKIVNIEKQENHSADWAEADCSYRVNTEIFNKEKGKIEIKTIYTEKIDVCTGFGSAVNPIKDEHMDRDLLESLSQYNPEKRFTPIVSANEFTLSKDQMPRNIVLVSIGAGGVGGNVFAKGTNGGDAPNIRVREFPKKPVNEVIWVARDSYDQAGKGFLTKKVLEYAIENGKLMGGDLRKVSYDAKTEKFTVSFAVKQTKCNGKPVDNKKVENLRFLPEKQDWTTVNADGEEKTVKEVWCELECEEIVYAAGQNPEETYKMSRELEKDLTLAEDSAAGMPIGLKTKDDNIHYFGAAAFQESKKLTGNPFDSATKKWLEEGHYPSDTKAPGLYAPTVAAIKSYAKTDTEEITAINVNTDDKGLMRIFFQGIKGLEHYKIHRIIEDILTLRESSETGISHKELQPLLNQYAIDDKVGLDKTHTHLISKQKAEDGS